MSGVAAEVSRVKRAESIRTADPSEAVELRRDARRFLGVLGLIWLGFVMIIDPLALGSQDPVPWSVVLGLRATGGAAIVAAWIAVPRCGRRGTIAVLAVAGAAITGLGAMIATATTGLEGPYLGTPVLWCMILAVVVAPRYPTAILLCALWLVSYVVATALGNRVELLDDPAEWTQLVASALVRATTLVLAVIASHRLWGLRHDLYESRRLGRYRMLSPIGRGGMNDVWLAWDEEGRREVALKLLRKPGSAAATRDRFAREAELVAGVRSPHIVEALDFGVAPGGYAYIAFEYLRGLDLEALVRGYGPIDPRRAVYLMRQACRGLGDAHAAGIVHGDVKPANLHCSDVRGSEDVVRILDFGVARAADRPEPALDELAAGTPAYMSPEAFAGAELTAASDVYGLGATFYFALAGGPPFDADDDGQLRRLHEQTPVLPPSLRRGADLPAALEAVILRCLAKAPADRYPDARAVRAALDALEPAAPRWSADDAAWWWRQARLGAPAVALAVAAGGGAVTEPGGPRASRRSRRGSSRPRSRRG